MSSGIYEILNTANGKRYVGSAANVPGRFAVHLCGLSKGTHHNRFLQQSWNKHGADAFRFNCLFVCAPNDLVFYEQRAIDVFNPEYNICRVAGNALGVKWSEESRAKKSEQQQAKPNFLGRKHSPETLAKMSAAKLGNTNTRGKKRSAAAVAKTAAAHTGMKRSAETRAKIAAKAIGRKRSPESVERGAAKLRGVPFSPEHRAKLMGNKNALGKSRNST